MIFFLISYFRQFSFKTCNSSSLTISILSISGSLHLYLQTFSPFTVTCLTWLALFICTFRLSLPLLLHVSHGWLSSSVPSDFLSLYCYMSYMAGLCLSSSLTPSKIFFSNFSISKFFHLQA